MNEVGPMVSERAAELRAEFDSVFSLAPSTERTPTDDVLTIRVGREGYAVRLTEVSGLVVDKELTRLPGSDPALLGLAGFRGAIVAVYDLGGLLGSAAGGSRRWLVLTGADPTIGLAFDHLDRYLRVPRDAITVEEQAPLRFFSTRQVVRIGPVAHPIVSISSIVEEIKTRVHQETVQKER